MRFARTIAVALSLALPVQAGELPDLGAASRAVMSEAQENQLGREIMRQVRVHRDYLNDAEIINYLNGLGERLAASSADPYRRFEFFAVQDPTINAFALPGGFIGLHTGLISAARDESELAGVLAHEIAHVTQHHIARMVDAQKTSGLVTLAALAVAILAARSNAQVSEAAVAVASAMSVQSQLDFTREHEREADRVGLQTLRGAGFAAQGMATFFERLQSKGRLYDNNAPAYLRTHPLTHERIADMQNRIADLPYKQRRDSREFALIRAKVQAAEGEARIALARFESLSRDSGGDAAVWYGLARAALRAGQTERAEQALQRLEALQTGSPMAETLAADIEQAAGRKDAAIARLEAARKRYSAYRPLAYAYARALLGAGRAAQARAFVDEQLLTWPEELPLLALKAEAHQALGQRLEMHLAQAEFHARQGAIRPAIEQLQLAQKSGRGDFYQQSRIEARIRELKERERIEGTPPGR